MRNSDYDKKLPRIEYWIGTLPKKLTNKISIESVLLDRYKDLRISPEEKLEMVIGELEKEFREMGYNTRVVYE